LPLRASVIHGGNNDAVPARSQRIPGAQDAAGWVEAAIFIQMISHALPSGASTLRPNMKP
jgi:hypothetical protein